MFCCGKPSCVADDQDRCRDLALISGDADAVLAYTITVRTPISSALPYEMRWEDLITKCPNFNIKLLKLCILDFWFAVTLELPVFSGPLDVNIEYWEIRV